MDLREAVQAALNTNPAIREAIHNKEATREERRQGEGRYYPTVSVEASSGVRGLRKELDALAQLGMAKDNRHVVLNYVDERAGLSERAKALRDQLTSLGPTQKLVLLRRIERGDDRISTYEATFASRVMTYEVGFAPDHRISVFELRDK